MSSRQFDTAPPALGERRARRKSERATAKTRKQYRPKRTVQQRIQSALALMAALALAGTTLIPAYSQTAAPAFADAGASEPLSATQTMAVPAEAGAEKVTRDGFQVVQSTPEGEPFAHIASTFSNNPNSAWAWPFDVGVPISSGFGPRSCAGCSSYHLGLDMNPGEGTPIQAIGDGVVVETGNPNGAFGVYAIIQHESNGQIFTSLYAHMLEGSLALEVGQTVTAGTLVGQVGNTGQSTGAHLHFGIYLDGVNAVDPYAFMKEKVGS